LAEQARTPDETNGTAPVAVPAPVKEETMQRNRSIATPLAVLALTILVVIAAASAAGAKSPPKASAGYAIVGTWDVTLALPGQPPGRVLATFEGDGTTVESAAVPAALRGASHGVWERIGPYLFSVTRVFFRFSPQTGAFLGTQKVNATVRVAQDGKTFTAVSISEQRDPAGTLIVGGLRGTAQAARIEVEQIPDRP
jgi:hypothetical protein